jgi:phosphoribosylformylglycinamidine cyclo-ligase
MSLKYDKRGVSASKSEVHAAIEHLDKGLYPNAFCKILPDYSGGNERFCNLLHADTAGTKTNLAYLYWRETGDLSVWTGIAQDAIVMNLDDIACVGCTDNFLLSSTIGRNKNLISGEVLAAVIRATSDFADKMKSHGVNIHLAGGETADVGDVVRTIDVGYTAFARMRRSEVVSCNIQPGDVVVGLASFGQATYEDAYNGGIGSNGLTSARHDVLRHEYASKYPESYDPAIPADVVYTGVHTLTEPVTLPSGTIPLGKLLLSPTRTYLPVLKLILSELRKKISALIHCTGGGQTKVMKFAHNVHIIKDNLFETPPLFHLMQQSGGTDWREMYQVFNMGHRMEVYLPARYAVEVIDMARSFGIDAQIIGRVQASSQTMVTVKSAHGEFEYR